jgi:lipoprotein-anchoring transpeptidase ErfK/SrfK
MKVRRFALRTAMLGMVLACTVSGASVALALPATLNVSAAGIPLGAYSYDASDTAAAQAGVAGFVNSVAPGFKVNAVNATRRINAKRRRVEFTAPADGRALDIGGSQTAISNEISRRAADLASPGLDVALPYSATAPSVTHFDKTIMVVLKQRKIYLYDNTKMIKTYRCAIGMPRYPTPTGTFVIRRKVKNPSWTNPGGAWGKGMPSYIRPGPSNPLGTRALYLYRGYSDTGVRFHGTTNRGSIGHAASHGCMRMRREDVEKFYKQVPLYTTVYIVK